MTVEEDRISTGGPRVVATGAKAGDPIGRDVWVVAAAVAIGLAMALLDTTIVNVALNALADDLHASLSSIQWVSTAYLLTLAVVIPTAGWASERFGSRRIWVVALAVFTAGSVLCGAAWSIGALIAFRVVQGIGGGLITPVGMSLIARTAGPNRMGRVMSVVGIPMLLTPVLGPVLGGVIVTISWRWIFYVNLLLGVAALVLARRQLPAGSGDSTGAVRLDRVGLATLAPGLAAVVFGLSQAQTDGGFAETRAWGPIAAGTLLVGAFVLHAHRVPHPLVEVRLFARAPFAAAASTIFFTGAALYGALFLTPLYFQLARGQSPLVAGLLVAPQGLGAALAMPLAGRITDRIGGGPVATAGLLVCAVATIPFTFVDARTPYGWLVAVLLVRGLGIGAALMPTTAAAYSTLRPVEIPRATSAISALQQLGGSVGVALLTISLHTHLGADGIARRPVSDALAGTTSHAFAHTYGWALLPAAVAFLTALALTALTRQPPIRHDDPLGD